MTQVNLKVAHRIRAISGRLSRLPFKDHPGLLFDPYREGYTGYAFGSRSGPTHSIVALFHELGHAAEFGIKGFRYRAAPHGFVFKIPGRYSGGRYNHFCSEFKTHQAIDRELRTHAHQYHLMRAAGYKVSLADFIQEAASLMRLLDDFWYIPGENEDERKNFCAQALSGFLTSIKADDTLTQLGGWLDRTVKRLANETADSRFSLKSGRGSRFYADGTAFD